jgi:F0F1-type ATP synthase membrane subunit c/vacuolar-type H+-ATPase subunit K
VLLSGTDWDSQLWWIMLAVGIAAVVVSIGAGYIGRKQVSWLTERQRFLLHLLSYVLLTVSIVVFIVRGLSAPR